MSEGMAEVQYGAQTLFLFVLADYLGLYLAGPLYGLYYLIIGKEPLRVLLEEAEEAGVADDAVLYDLGQPCLYLPLFEGLQYVRVYEDRHRLVEGADEVLALGGVYRGLSGPGTVHLGEERRGHLYKGHATEGGRRHEPREAAYDAAATG